jgi:hypothetical protein
VEAMRKDFIADCSESPHSFDPFTARRHSSARRRDGHLNTIYATTVVCFLQDNNNKALLFLEATSRSGEGAVI